MTTPQPRCVIKTPQTDIYSEAPHSASSPPPKPNTPQTSSTTNAAAASTTKAQQNSMLTSPCSDH